MKLIKTTLILFLSFLTFSCSNDDDIEQQEQEEQEELDQFHLEISGKYFVDWCGVEDNSSKIMFSFLEDGVVKSTITGESNTQQLSEIFDEDLSGNIIGVKIELQDYDPNNLTGGSYGDGFGQISLRIYNGQDELVLDEELYSLVHCTDIGYEVTALYNTDLDELNMTGKSNSM